MEKYCYVLFDGARPKDIIGVFETKNGMYKYLTKEYYDCYNEQEFGKLETFDDEYCEIEVITEDERVLDTFRYYGTYLYIKGE